MRMITDDTSAGYHLARYAALVISGVLMGIPIGSMFCQPTAKAVVTTRLASEVLGSTISVAQLNLDAEGSVIANCYIKP